jgi:phenylalanyl-tRNA synthetase beta chain
MKFSLDWLRDHVEIDLPAGEVARGLTSVGLAVESIDRYGDDWIFDVEITGNRPDCMSHRGLAREIAAFTGRPLRPLDTALREGDRPVESLASVRIDEPDLCSRYTARVLLGVRIGPSPAWLERRLRAIGLQPKWNVVDAANYVLWDLGHPLHTFDRDRLDGHAIVVRRARPGEHLVTVADGLDHSLQDSMLLIADGSRPVAVAGVMGGLDSGISETCRDILIESAWFDPVSVRRTARALGMHTDASHRFERGADAGITVVAADRLARLTLEVAGGELARGVIDVVARPRPIRRARLRRDRMAGVLGATVPDDVVATKLGGLEIPIEPTADGWLGTIPSHRSDIEVEEDLIEEVARSVGYDHFPSTLPAATVLPPNRHADDDADTRVREALGRLGFHETIGYAMVGREEDEALAPAGALPALGITNPLSERWEVLRRSLLPGLARAAGHNLRHGMRDLALYEIGTTFHRLAGPDGPVGRPFREERVAALIGVGRAGSPRWNLPMRAFDLYDASGAFEAVATAVGAGPVRCEPLSTDETRHGQFLHPGRSFQVRVAGALAGFGGELHPEIAARLELPPGCIVGQIALALLLTTRRPAPRFRPLSRFPSINRDVSAIVPADTAFRRVDETLAEALVGAPARAVLIDRYAGAPLPEGKVSLTFSILIEPEDRTWTVEEIDGLVERVIALLRERVGADIRR